NADGSYGAMCGNGIRCVAKYVYDNGLTDKNPVTIESGGSLKTLYLTVANGKVEKVRVDMGKPEFRPDKIPADTGAFAECGGDSIVNAMYTVNGRDYRVTAVSMGNPHAVIFTNDADSLDLVRDGPLFEHHKAFPECVNTEFIKVLDRESIKMRVWERGSGETLACGTGACSAVAACVLNGLTGRSVKVFLKGGELDIEWNEEDGHIYMTGPAVTVFRGEI
ncbi:MAG: diaminopimelate epimerase, partial [Lachnospiraceae bacterium]|nr:diaminopimelate epimerase [Lachnospiraceae bacterium]